jgi:hypothetical protein
MDDSVSNTKLILAFVTCLDKLTISRPETLSIVTMTFFYERILIDREKRLGKNILSRRSSVQL